MSDEHGLCPKCGKQKENGVDKWAKDACCDDCLGTRVCYNCHKYKGQMEVNREPELPCHDCEYIFRKQIRESLCKEIVIEEAGKMSDRQLKKVLTTDNYLKYDRFIYLKTSEKAAETTYQVGSILAGICNPIPFLLGVVSGWYHSTKYTLKKFTKEK